jgi:hypothetical protein
MVRASNYGAIRLYYDSSGERADEKHEIVLGDLMIFSLRAVVSCMGPFAEMSNSSIHLEAAS